MVAGIDLDPDKPGYTRILIQPQPGGQLTYAGASLDSMVGRIESRWMREDDAFQLAVTIPANTEAVVRLPTKSVDGIMEQAQPLDQVDGIREMRQEGETVIIVVGSGHYHFGVKIE